MIHNELEFAADMLVCRYPSGRKTCTAERSCVHGNSTETAHIGTDVGKDRRSHADKLERNLALALESIRHVLVDRIFGSDGSSVDLSNKTLPSVGCGSKCNI